MIEDLTGYKVRVTDSSKFGIVLEVSKENGEDWKYSVSHDSDEIISRLLPENIQPIEKIEDIIFFKRLLRDLNSSDRQTRICSSVILCNYVEDNNSLIHFYELYEGMRIILERLKIEKDPDVGYKLSESIFEIIWLEKLDEKKETELLIEIAQINSDWTLSYLDNEDYIKIQEVKEYVESKKKEYHRDCPE